MSATGTITWRCVQYTEHNGTTVIDGTERNCQLGCSACIPTVTSGPFVIVDRDNGPWPSTFDVIEVH